MTDTQESPPSAHPLSRIATERRQQILDAALFCFARSGFHQTAMAEVCAEAKLSPGSVYRYFRSKDDIIAGLADAEHQIMAQFYERVRELPTLREAVDALIGFWLDSNSEPAERRAGGETLQYFMVYVELCAEATRNPRVAAIAAQYDAAQLAIVRDVLESAKNRGELDETASCDMLARLLSATLDGLMFRCAYDHSLPPASYRQEARAFLYRALNIKDGND